MSWIYLLIASIFEIGWPVGLKLSTGNYKFFWILFAVVTMLLSGYFLLVAQKNIPIGTAYAIWTGIGTIGTFLIGVIFFNDTANLAKYLGIIFILSGIIILKVNH